ncbi:hypothetical protein HD553DRAFT_273761 [Filobasidium floriforme]|uniref:uncharacterized protein n=1 Tax=Filobasidium floriforme TaxID=5210 RepID=UPI001E8E60FF|nr:uncharacterized protein HD553DRAFT_273761 [Filobasidium floriforme]KAH8083135.1 hypothetical protein HD553DRAFT_273761 [Filobasidium floriforme]
MPDAATGILSQAPPHPRRFVTSHDEQGNAIFKIEGDIPHTQFYKSEEECAVFHVPWTTEGLPVTVSDTGDRAVTKAGGSLARENGIVCRYVDFPPNTFSPMHRTHNHSYNLLTMTSGVVIFGDLELVLDNGETRQMTQSDVVVQRGTIHQWNNKTDKWARMMFVLIASDPVMIDGKPLPSNL